jgi:hypothetical protein
MTDGRNLGLIGRGEERRSVSTLTFAALLVVVVAVGPPPACEHDEWPGRP